MDMRHCLKEFHLALYGAEAELCHDIIIFDTTGLKKYEVYMFVLPLPRLIIVVNQINFDRIIQAFQNIGHIGELRQGWEKIKRLQTDDMVAAIKLQMPRDNPTIT